MNNNNSTTEGGGGGGSDFLSGTEQQSQQQLQQQHDSSLSSHITSNNINDNNINNINNNSNSNSNQQHHYAIPPPSRQVSQISEPKVKSGLFGTTSNLVNSIVGAGIIAIPFALRESGLIPGCIMLVLVAYLTDKSLRILVDLASYHPRLLHHGWNVQTYEDLMSFPYGRYGSSFVLGSMLIFAYGAMVAYLLIIKDTVPTILGIQNNNNDNNDNNNNDINNTRENFLKREIVLIVTTAVIIVPLSVQRDMAHLAFTSFWSVMADVILVIFIAVYSPIPSSLQEAGGFAKVVLEDNFINSHIFVGLGIFSSAMACQHCAFIVSGSLENATSTRWAMVTFRSVSMATVLCAILGITGYLGFLNDTQGDVLNNFRPDTIAANGARVLLAITMFFTYPMEAFVARHVLIKLFYNGDIDGDTIDEHNGQVRPEVKWCCGCLGRRQITTIAIYLATLLPALLVDNLGPVLSITGALGGSCISYIGPGLAYLGVNSDFFLEWVSQMLHETKLRKEPPPGELELPVVGGSVGGGSGGGETEAMTSYAYDPSRHGCRLKPWWWWPTGFPIWCAIASWADHGMKAKLASAAVVDGGSGGSGSLFVHNTSSLPPPPPLHHQQPAQPQDNEDHAQRVTIVGPNKRDCIIAIFLIVFGVVAAVVGVASNIYVELKNIFHTQK